MRIDFNTDPSWVDRCRVFNAAMQGTGFRAVASCGEPTIERDGMHFRLVPVVGFTRYLSTFCRYYGDEGRQVEFERGYGR